MERKGIDISKHNGSSVDFNKLKSDGIEFVIIRAGYGRFTSQEDVEFENNYAKAKAAGMPVGAYWYSYATSVGGAVAEANACIEVIKGKQFEYPIYFDLEDPSQSGLGKATLSDMVVAFCETLEAAGYFVGLYANLNWLNNYLDYSKIKNYSIWLAQWSSKPTYKNTFDMWQYTSDGTTSGTPGRTDMNICYRDFPAEIKAGKFNGFNDSSVSEGSGSVNSGTNVKPSDSGFNVGDKVKVKSGSKSYSGQSIASFVYDNVYTIDELSGNRAVLDKNGICTAFNTDDLVLASSATKNPVSNTSNEGINVGDVVKVNSGAKTYDGEGLADFVYTRNHVVSEKSGDRVVITYDGVVVAAVHSKDLTKVGSTSTSSSSSSSNIKKGTKVKVKSGATDYNGKSLASFVYTTTYTVLEEPNGDRVVIGLDGVVTAAVSSKNLTIVG